MATLSFNIFLYSKNARYIMLIAARKVESFITVPKLSVVGIKLRSFEGCTAYFEGTGNVFT